jgi:hypothetical protein
MPRGGKFTALAKMRRRFHHGGENARWFRRKVLLGNWLAIWDCVRAGRR